MNRFDHHSRRWSIITPSRGSVAGDWWLEVYRSDATCTTRYWFVDECETLADAVREVHAQVRETLCAEREGRWDGVKP